MQFVVGGMMSVGAHRSEKRSVIIETSGQLVGVSFVETAFQGIIPTQGLVGVQGIASADANAVEAGIVAQFACNVEKIGQAALPPTVIRFVKGSNRYYLTSSFLYATGGDIHQLCPVLGIAGIPGIDAGVIAIQGYLGMAACQINKIKAIIEIGYLLRLQISVHQGHSGLKGSPDQINIFTAHKSNSPYNVVAAGPGGVEPPEYWRVFSAVRQIERNYSVGNRLRMNGIGRGQGFCLGPGMDGGPLKSPVGLSGGAGGSVLECSLSIRHRACKKK